MSRRIYSLWLLICMFVCVPAQADDLSVAERNAQMGFNDTIDRLAEDFIEASILVADQGYELFSVLGHMAIRVKCPTFDMDYVFSYEGEQVEARFFTFLKGDLKMGVFCIEADRYLRDFAAEKKGLTEYRLNLSPEQEIKLWEILDRELVSVTDVKYDLFTRGCAASIRKWVSEAVRPNKISYHEPLCTHGKLISDIFLEQTEHDWAQFFIATIGGGVLVYGNTLSDIERLVTPHDIVREWQRATINDKQLLSKGERIVEYVPIEKKWFSPLVFALLILLISIVNIFVKQPYIDYFLLTMFTIFGCIIVFTQYLHPMSVIGWSWLVIPFNPLPAIFWKWRNKWALPYFIIVLLWCIGVLVAPHRVTTYAHVVLAVAFSALWLKVFIRK